VHTRCTQVVWKLLVVSFALALVVPGAARAKWTGDLRMCGASGCRIVDRHLAHDEWPTLAAITAWPANAGPPPPGPFYRLTIVSPQGAESEPMYLVPRAHRARNSDGGGGAYWTRYEELPAKLVAAVRALRPFPAPRVTRVVVGGKVARNPHTYLRLFRLPPSRGHVRDPAGRLGVEPTLHEVVAYWERVRRLYLPIELASRRETPWSDFHTSLWIGRKHDLVLRDGEVVRIPGALAVRVRRAQSLR
jgi:hypothetical protein